MAISLNNNVNITGVSSSSSKQNQTSHHQHSLTTSSSSFRFFKIGNVGGGAWYTIHLLAAHGERVALEAVILRFAKSFTCVKCRFHIRSFVSRHPIPPSPDELFDWSILFHNTVNERINEELKKQKQQNPKKNKPILSKQGADALLFELTVIAESDEREALINVENGDKIECVGCEEEDSQRRR